MTYQTKNECIKKITQDEMNKGKSEKEALQNAFNHCINLFRGDSYEGSITRSGWFTYDDGTVFKEFDNLIDVAEREDIVPAYDYHEGERKFIGFGWNFDINKQKETIDCQIEFFDEPEGEMYDVSIGFPDKWKKRADGTIIQELRGLDHIAVNVNKDWVGRCGPMCRIYKSADALAKDSISGSAASKNSNTYIKNEGKGGKKSMPEKKEDLDSTEEEQDNEQSDHMDYIQLPKEEFESFKEEFETIKSHYDSLVQEKVCDIKEKLVKKHNVAKDAIDNLSVAKLELLDNVFATIPKRGDSKKNDGITEEDARKHMDSVETSIKAYQERIAKMRGGM